MIRSIPEDHFDVVLQETSHVHSHPRGSSFQRHIGPFRRCNSERLLDFFNVDLRVAKRIRCAATGNWRRGSASWRGGAEKAH